MTDTNKKHLNTVEATAASVTMHSYKPHKYSFCQKHEKLLNACCFALCATSVVTIGMIVFAIADFVIHLIFSFIKDVLMIVTKGAWPPFTIKPYIFTYGTIILSGLLILILLFLKRKDIAQAILTKKQNRYMKKILICVLFPITLPYMIIKYNQALKRQFCLPLGIEDLKKKTLQH